MQTLCIQPLRGWRQLRGRREAGVAEPVSERARSDRPRRTCGAPTEGASTIAAAWPATAAPVDHVLHTPSQTIARRPLEDGMFIASRYFATVLRAMERDCSGISAPTSASEHASRASNRP